MKVALYSSFNERLIGTLDLAPTGIVPRPAGAPHERERHLEKLQRFLRNWRPGGVDDATFLKRLPALLPGRARLLGEGEEPFPGFDSLPDDVDQTLAGL